MKKFIPHLVVLITVLLTSAAFAAGNWPTWRGPDMMGISADATPPVTWSESKNIKWKIKLEGDGSPSTPVIWQDKLFYQIAVDTGKKAPAKKSAEPSTADTGNRSGRSGRGRSWGSRRKTSSNIFRLDLVCLNRHTGKVIWQKTITEQKPHQAHHGDNGFASFSPVTDGKHVWASLGSWGIHCFDIDGEHIWSRDTIKMKNRWGDSNSPALAGNAVIVVADQEGDSFIYAFEKTTGKPLWKKSRDEISGWATPVVTTVNGKQQIIVNGGSSVKSYDPKNGDIIWKCSGQTRNAIPCPVVGNSMVYCTSGFRGSALMAIKLGKTGDLTGTDAIAWQVSKATPYVPSPLLYQGRVYVYAVNNASLSCYDAKTGKPHFVKQSLDQMKGVYASPAAAAGKIYLAGRRGVTCVIKPADQLKTIAINKLDDSFDCSPAFAGTELYLKGKKYLYCISSQTD
ncbi:MAG: PQQ-binding-like beta-propeller repeat protein [Planctomycetes bacterium]|nr:PQQ-binding-like beta-propeller repeat protein [Planctomycetota bacterium]